MCNRLIPSSIIESWHKLDNSVVRNSREMVAFRREMDTYEELCSDFRKRSMIRLREFHALNGLTDDQLNEYNEILRSFLSPYMDFSLKRYKEIVFGGLEVIIKSGESISGKELEIVFKEDPLPIQSKKEILDYFTLAQSSAFNILTKKLTTKITNPAQFDMYGNGKIETKDFRLFIKGYKELTNGINTSAAKLLDALLITATAEGMNSTLVNLPLEEYMEMRGLKDEKTTRAQVKRDINALERIRFEYKGQGKQRGNWLNVTLAGGTSGIKNSVISFRFNEDFYASLKVSETKYLYMYFPREALRLNDNANPYSYHLARKASEHKRMNLGKLNENVISVKTLVESCPNFPTHDEVMTSNGAITSRMIEPFERDMDAVFKWQYTGEQPETYQEFIESCVRIVWENYPDTAKLKQNKTKQRQRTTEKKTLAKKINDLEKRLEEVENRTPEL